LAKDVGEVGLYRASGDEQAPTDLHVGESLGHQSHDLELGGSETLPPPQRPLANPPPASWHSHAPQGRDRATEVQRGADTVGAPDGRLQPRPAGPRPRD